MKAYLYTVNPRIPIRNVVPRLLITREANVILTLEQVKECLKHGPVYRKFDNTSIQVTLDNCERLHQRDYEEYIDADSTFIPKEEKPTEKDAVDKKIEDLVPEIPAEEPDIPKAVFVPPSIEEIEPPVEVAPEEATHVVENTEAPVEETPAEEAKAEEVPVENTDSVEVPVEEVKEEETTPVVENAEALAEESKVEEKPANTANNNHHNNKYYNKKYKK